MDSAQFMQGILESLGWAILHSFWQMALLWLAYQLFFGVRNRVSPQVRHHGAVLAMLIGTGWFVATFVREYGHFLEIGRYLALVPETMPSSTRLPASGVTLTAIIQTLTTFTAEHIAWLSAVYLFTLALMGWKLLQGYLQVHTLRLRGVEPAGPALQQQVEQLARRLSISFPVRVHLSRLVDVPATFGVLKPLVLLPVACITQLSPAQLESILLHELAHIRRMDYLVNLVVGLMETLLWHNPFAWWFARSIRRERELCCDDIVLAQRQDALEYAAALLSLEQQRRMPAVALAMASNGQQGQLLQRIRRITRTTSNVSSPSHRLMAVGLMFLLMLSMAWVRPPASRAETPMARVRLSRASEEISRVILAPAPQDLTRQAESSRSITEKSTRSSKETLGFSTDQYDGDNMMVIPPPPDPFLPSPRIYVNEAPPESHAFTFTIPAVEDALIFVPGSPGMPAIAPGWIPEAPQDRKIVPDAQVLQDRDWQALQKQQENLERMIRAELEQERSLRAFGRAIEKKQPGQERQRTPHQAAPRISLPDVLLQAPIEKMYQGQALDPQVWQELYRQQLPQDVLKRVQATRNLTKETVKVNRIKTREGYTLRIVTEKESIDIRIAEDDIVVEKN